MDGSRGIIKARRPTRGSLNKVSKGPSQGAGSEDAERGVYLLSIWRQNQQDIDGDQKEDEMIDSRVSGLGTSARTLL